MRACEYDIKMGLSTVAIALSLATAGDIRCLPAVERHKPETAR